ncbi:carboxymuconolactone decarboxylase family protein (plasmid) [Cellulomonas sp. WB94]|uniref:carboxymuconolactone decarboxylase family protein n=1 Tax=Cellulomonas sp. WB94 TaxID=2173174 RepID=UPI000D567614|nr:carboxymuconolactone decarboxylase family protein [Cellulomonas sp. WB94]PVU81417.1 carboxymuconolactone decarboxylase family protein [Cellulomonas sp. WB94]
MTRLAPVRTATAKGWLRITYWFTARAIERLTDRRLEAMIEPIQVYARNPRLLRGYAAIERATAGLHALPKRLRALAELRAATMIACPFCIDLGSQVARRWGLTDEEILALATYRSSPLFSGLEKVVLDYATAMSSTPVVVPDELFTALREHLDDAQLLELTHVIALENHRGRFNLALAIGAAGFSAGAACAVPAPAISHQNS